MSYDLMLRAKANESLTIDEMRARLPAIFAQDPHHSRSDRYIYVSTEHMLDELMKQEFVPVEARVSRSRDTDRQSHTKHMVRLRHRGDMVTGGERRVGGTSFEVILRNAHDGTSSYQFMAGLLRLICLNGAVVSDGTVSSVKVMHSGNRERQIGQIIEGAHTVLDQGPKVIEKVCEWQQIELKRDEQIAFAESARTIRFGDADGRVETPITADMLLNARRYDDRGNDLWRTFNRVQENIIRGGLVAYGRDANNRRRRTTTREVRSIDGDVRLNKALWSIAEKMAELKAA